MSPLLSYARVLLDKSSVEFSPESLHEELSPVSSVAGRLPVKTGKSINRPICARWRSSAKINVPHSDAIIVGCRGLRRSKYPFVGHGDWRHSLHVSARWCAKENELALDVLLINGRG